jgi:hypothetical protein
VQGRAQFHKLRFHGSALTVLTAARDLSHVGWKLLHHPLYGNYRPSRQPYRTLLMELADTRKAPAEEEFRPDILSLRLLDAAFEVYGNCRVLAPEDAPGSMRKDCALLDAELMRLPLEQAGAAQQCIPCLEQG